MELGANAIKAALIGACVAFAGAAMAAPLEPQGQSQTQSTEAKPEGKKRSISVPSAPAQGAVQSAVQSARDDATRRSKIKPLR